MVSSHFHCLFKLHVTPLLEGLSQFPFWLKTASHNIPVEEFKRTILVGLARGFGAAVPS